jgi:hypothetical protein
MANETKKANSMLNALIRNVMLHGQWEMGHNKDFQKNLKTVLEQISPETYEKLSPESAYNYDFLKNLQGDIDKYYSKETEGGNDSFDEDDEYDEEKEESVSAMPSKKYKDEEGRVFTLLGEEGDDYVIDYGQNNKHDRKGVWYSDKKKHDTKIGNGLITEILDTNDNGKIEKSEMENFTDSLNDYMNKNKKGRDDIPVTTRR